MANDNNIKTFTAGDIEKYHKGVLPANEMHAIEKAALDDPFLADALEGYAVSGVNVDTDISELRSRLAKRTKEENKTVPIATTNKTVSFSWWKVAAMFVLIAGAGLIVYQLGFTNKKNDIAQAVSKEAENTATKDSGSSGASTLISTDTNTRSTATAEQKNNLIKTEDQKNVSTSLAKEQAEEKNTNPKIAKEIEAAEAPTLPIVTPGVALEKSKEKEEALNDDSQKKIILPKQEELKARRQNNDVAGTVREAEQKRNVAAQNQPVENNFYKTQERKAFNQTNVFRGRVTDTYNNALPFSNITNTEDSIGTYSDARGYFILTSPDSVLNVQVRSLGFESNNVQLQNNVPNNPVQLQEDRSSLAEVVISNRKPNSKRARDGNMVLQEPEPADGWSNYDIYLANNLKVPKSFKDKPAGNMGEVELSFDIDKNGGPFNITVKKSLCDSCDKEAIRLVKEGPKWKRKAKKGKATVKIAF